LISRARQRKSGVPAAQKGRGTERPASTRKNSRRRSAPCRQRVGHGSRRPRRSAGRLRRAPLLIAPPETRLLLPSGPARPWLRRRRARSRPQQGGRVQLQGREPGHPRAKAKVHLQSLQRLRQHERTRQERAQPKRQIKQPRRARPRRPSLKFRPRRSDSRHSG